MTVFKNRFYVKIYKDFSTNDDKLDKKFNKKWCLHRLYDFDCITTLLITPFFIKFFY